MANQIKCQCTVTRFQVSDMMGSSSPRDNYFFHVFACCVDCGKVVIIAEHTMQGGASLELFKEHHNLTMEFYEELS